MMTGRREAALLSLVLMLLSILKHGRDIAGIRRGATKKTDVLKMMGEKLKGRKE
jgi:hypothetical protein